MIGEMRKAFNEKTDLITQLLGFLTVFSLMLGGIFSIIYLFILNEAVPLYIYVVFQIAGYLPGGFFLLLLIKRLINRPEEKSRIIPEDEENNMEFFDENGNEKIPSTESKKTQTGSRKNIIAFYMNFVFGILIVQIFSFMLPVLMNFKKDMIFYASAAAMITLFILFNIFIITALNIAGKNVKAEEYLGCLINGIKIYFGSIRIIVITLITGIFAIVLLSAIIFILWPYVSALAFSPVLMIMYRNAVIASIGGTYIVYSLKVISVIAKDKNFKDSVKGTKISYAVAGVLFAALILSFMPLPGGGFSEDYMEITEKAEKYREEGKLYLCGNEYKKAYAIVQGYIGMLKEVQARRDEKMDDAKKNEMFGEAETNFRKAYDFYPNSGELYYYDSLRKLESNKGAALSVLERGKEYSANSAQYDFLMLDLSNELKREELKKNVTDRIIGSGEYIKPRLLSEMSSGKIKKELEKAGEYEKECLKNIVTIAYDYYNNQLYPEAMQELKTIQSILPDDLVTNYLIAMTDLELKSDNKQYKDAIEAAKRILNQYPNEKWAQELYSGVAIRAGNQGVMDVALKDAYEKNPDNLDIAEQYAYSILKKNYNSSYYDVTQQAEKIIDEILIKDRERWFALYCKSLIELFKGEYENSMKMFTDFSDIMIENSQQYQIYDELYNTYVMKYARRMEMDTKAVEIIDGYENIDAFLFNYIKGAFYSRNRDSQKSIEHLNASLNYATDFSKIYYMLGNEYMEKGHSENNPEFFNTAEDYYKKSIELFEDDPYAWFALGHSYKRQNRYEDALGAFQKTLTLMPAEDHQSDHFGVSIHSTFQIDEIKRILASKEVQ